MESILKPTDPLDVELAERLRAQYRDVRILPDGSIAALFATCSSRARSSWAATIAVTAAASALRTDRWLIRGSRNFRAKTTSRKATSHAAEPC